MRPFLRTPRPLICIIQTVLLGDKTVKLFDWQKILVGVHGSFLRTPRPLIFVFRSFLRLRLEDYLGQQKARKWVQGPFLRTPRPLICIIQTVLLEVETVKLFDWQKILVGVQHGSFLRTPRPLIYVFRSFLRARLEDFLA